MLLLILLSNLRNYFRGMPPRPGRHKKQINIEMWGCGGRRLHSHSLHLKFRHASYLIMTLSQLAKLFPSPVPPGLVASPLHWHLFLLLFFGFFVFLFLSLLLFSFVFVFRLLVLARVLVPVLRFVLVLVLVPVSFSSWAFVGGCCRAFALTSSPAMTRRLGSLR